LPAVRQAYPQLANHPSLNLLAAAVKQAGIVAQQRGDML
jgi:hypothetical protein